MRNMKCHSLRREIEEAAPGDLLSSAVEAHIQSCTECETLLREQTKLRAIVSSLGTVEVPGDFDFRLRARLAGESRGTARPTPLLGFSFGLRSAAVAMVLLVIGAAFVVVSFRAQPGQPASAGQQLASNPVAPPAVDNATDDVKPAQVALVPKQSKSNTGSRTGIHRGGVSQFASSKGNNTLTMSSTRAPVLRLDAALAETYPTAAFPINASNQSLRVSVDDGRGSSRTISLPTVSFGSQRALSQNTPPLMASARGVW